MRRDGTTVTFATVEGQLAGVLAISDPIKTRRRPRFAP